MRNIYVSFNHVLTISKESHPSPHRHLMSHIVISYNEPLSFIVNNKLVESRGIIVDSGVEHTINCNNQEHMLFLFDTGSDIHKAIKDKYLSGRDYYEIDDEIIYKIQEDKFFQNINNARNYREIFNRLCRQLQIQEHEIKISDKRIRDIIKWIKNEEGIEDNVMDEILKISHLSKSRISHLFKLEVGSSLNSYILLMKTIKAYKYVFKGHAITDAALNAGFSSSNHFAATSRKMIGFSPRELKKECLYCEFENF